LGTSTTVTPDAPPAATPRWSDPVTPENFLLTTFEPGLGELIRSNSEWRSGHLLALNATEPLHRQVERTLANARDQAQLQIRLNIKLVLMDPHVRQARFPLARLNWKPIADQPGLLIAELAAVDLDYVTTNLRLNSRPSKELETTNWALKPPLMDHRSIRAFRILLRQSGQGFERLGVVRFIGDLSDLLGVEHFA
jgi:hypothetical protein